MREGRVRRSYIGVAGGSRPLPPRLAAEVGRQSAVEIVEVVDGSPAAAAGLRPGDLIVEADGEAIEDVGDLQRLMSGERIGRAVPLRVDRGGRLDAGRDRPARARGLAAYFFFFFFLATVNLVVFVVVFPAMSVAVIVSR